MTSQLCHDFWGKFFFAGFALASISKEEQFDNQRSEATFHQNWGGGLLVIRLLAQKGL